MCFIDVIRYSCICEVHMNPSFNEGPTILNAGVQSKHLTDSKQDSQLHVHVYMHQPISAQKPLACIDVVATSCKWVGHNHLLLTVVYPDREQEWPRLMHLCG